MSESSRCKPSRWSKWRRFPDPGAGGLLTAPFGPGCYELRNGSKRVLFGISEHVAYRMSSLLPPPHGCGHRSNSAKRQYVLANLGTMEYRTRVCTTREEAARRERAMTQGGPYLFPT